MTNKKEDIGISSLNSSTKKEDIGIISSNSSTAIAVAQLKTLQEEIIQKIRNGEWTTNGPRNEPSYLFGNQEIRDFFGDPREHPYGLYPSEKKGKRIFSENDPYGEENWEE